MSEGNKKKVYGLIIPQKTDQGIKKASTSTPAYNVFGDDQDSDEGEKTKGPVGPYGFTKTNTKLKLQNQMDIEKAMMEDPSVYEYDEIYDDIQASKPQLGKQEETKTKKIKKPQYITGLLKAAEEKKKELERRNERKVQKEREAEGQMYADKEAFVTSAYKQKMLERQKEEEDERRKEEIEAMTDVTKQKDLGGFYRYLYRQTTGPEDEKIKEEPQDEIEPKKESIKTSSRRRRSSSSSSSSSVSNKSNSERKPTEKTQVQKHMGDSKSKHRNFRKRRADSSSDEEENYKNKKRIDENNGSRNRNSSDEQENRSKQSGSNRSKLYRKSPSPQRRFKGDDRNLSKGRGRRSRSPLSPENRKRTEKSKENKSRRDRRSLSQSPSPLSPSSRRKSPAKRGQEKRRLSVSRSNSREKSSSNEKHKHKSQTHSKDQEKHQPDVDNRDQKRDRYENNETITKKQVDKNGTHDKGTSDSGEDDKINEVIAVKPSQNVERPDVVKKIKVAPIDPKDKVYPHHNSPKDIEEARKRYLIRKLEREKARGS